MIALDTNVISELMRASPSGRVLSWLDATPLSSIYVTTITEAEVLAGVMLLPRGKRRDAIAAAAAAMFERFGSRVLPFDRDAARAYADIVATRRRSGRPISAFDAQIAAIVRSVGATLATRNLTDFVGCDVDLIDPWRPPA